MQGTSPAPYIHAVLSPPRAPRNVPGVAMYMASLTQLRTLMARSPHFARVRTGVPPNANGSVLPTLTSQGNLFAGATTRVAVGFLLNPFSVLKARFEVRLWQICVRRG